MNPNNPDIKIKYCDCRKCLRGENYLGVFIIQFGEGEEKFYDSWLTERREISTIKYWSRMNLYFIKILETFQVIFNEDIEMGWEKEISFSTDKERYLKVSEFLERKIGDVLHDDVYLNL